MEIKLSLTFEKCKFSIFQNFVQILVNSHKLEPPCWFADKTLINRLSGSIIIILKVFCYRDLTLCKCMNLTSTPSAALQIRELAPYELMCLSGTVERDCDINEVQSLAN